MWLHETNWSSIDVSEDKRTIMIFDKDTARISTSEDPDPFAYFTPNLLGGYMTYDVNMAEVPCGCISSLFSTLLPARQEDGELWAK